LRTTCNSSLFIVVNTYRKSNALPSRDLNPKPEW
jgi:hypothetical protein